MKRDDFSFRAATKTVLKSIQTKNGTMMTVTSSFLLSAKKQPKQNGARRLWYLENKSIVDIEVNNKKNLKLMWLGMTEDQCVQEYGCCWNPTLDAGSGNHCYRPAMGHSS